MLPIEKYICNNFGCEEKLFISALENSPSSRGYVLGAISEIILQQHLNSLGYEVFRIIEKPSGGNNAKNAEARGDFYVRKKDSNDAEWLVIEVKGLKSNSEFRGSKFDTPNKVFRYLKPLVFPAADAKKKCYQKGLLTYRKKQKTWEQSHPHKTFPEFRWSEHRPGPISCNLSGIWDSPESMKKYLENLPKSKYTESSYRDRTGSIIVLETHKPSTRIAPITGIKQAAPLVGEFSILAVDLFLRTGKHEFAFLNPLKISHSPGSPEHLYQNYTIDILIPGIKNVPILEDPWYLDFEKCVSESAPIYLPIDLSQIDHRKDL